MPLPIVPAPITPTVFMSIMIDSDVWRSQTAVHRDRLSSITGRLLSETKTLVCSGSDYDAAVHGNHRPVDEAGLIRRQPGIGIGHVFRRSHASQRSTGDHPVQDLFGHRPDHISGNESGSDGVNTNVVL